VGQHGRVDRPAAGFDDQISWPTAVRGAPDLAWGCAGGYSVGPWIDGKKTVYTVMPRLTVLQGGTAHGRLSRALVARIVIWLRDDVDYRPELAVVVYRGPFTVPDWG